MLSSVNNQSSDLLVHKYKDCCQKGWNSCSRNGPYRIFTQRRYNPTPFFSSRWLKFQWDIKLWCVDAKCEIHAHHYYYGNQDSKVWDNCSNLQKNEAFENYWFPLIYRHWWNTKIFPEMKLWYPAKKQFSSFTCEDITVVMATSVMANRKRASQHLAISVYIIHRTLHAHLWIWLLSSRVQFDISWEIKMNTRR